MKELKKKKLDELGIKRYVSPPNLSFVGGIILKPEMEFEDLTEVDDSDKEINLYNVKRIEQTLKDCTLTTITTSEIKYNGFHTVDKQETIEEFPKDREILLIYKRDKGWGIADAKLMSVEEAIRGMEYLLVKEK